jgi:hypothetical protein
MVALNRNGRFSPAASNPNSPVNPMAERVRWYFVRHPEVVPEDFLLDAVGRELARREGLGPNSWSANRSRLTEEDIRLHAWLNERLTALHRERHRLGPSMRRFFLGNRLVRWLASGR